MTDDLNRDWSAGDGNYYEHADLYKRVQLLIIEDLMTTPIETRNAVGLFEIVEAREGWAAALISSRPEPDEQHLRIKGKLMVGSIPNRIATWP